MYVDSPQPSGVAFLKAPGAPSQSPLRTLSHLLRHRELWPKHFQWDFKYCPSCAIGLAQRAGLGHPHRDLPEDVRGDIFCRATTKRVRFLLFFTRPARTHEVTPEMVADQIDDYLTRAE